MMNSYINTPNLFPTATYNVEDVLTLKIGEQEYNITLTYNIFVKTEKKLTVISWNRFILKTLTNSESLPKGVAHFELWIVNSEFWIGYELQARTSGGSFRENFSIGKDYREDEREKKKKEEERLKQIGRKKIGELWKK